MRNSGADFVGTEISAAGRGGNWVLGVAFVSSRKWGNAHTDAGRRDQGEGMGQTFISKTQLLGQNKREQDKTKLQNDERNPPTHTHTVSLWGHIHTYAPRQRVWKDVPPHSSDGPVPRAGLGCGTDVGPGCHRGAGDRSL